MITINWDNNTRSFSAENKPSLYRKGLNYASNNQALVGGVGGALVGGIGGALLNRRAAKKAALSMGYDDTTDEYRRLVKRSTIKGALGGAAIGGTIGGLGGYANQTRTKLKNTSEALDVTKGNLHTVHGMYLDAKAKAEAEMNLRKEAQAQRNKANEVVKYVTEERDRARKAAHLYRKRGDNMGMERDNLSRENENLTKKVNKAKGNKGNEGVMSKISNFLGIGGSSNKSQPKKTPSSNPKPKRQVNSTPKATPKAKVTQSNPSGTSHIIQPTHQSQGHSSLILPSNFTR